jgi:hypothetical protein
MNENNDLAMNIKAKSELLCENVEKEGENMRSTISDETESIEVYTFLRIIYSTKQERRTLAES